jgi:hypothetical protein
MPHAFLLSLLIAPALTLQAIASAPEASALVAQHLDASGGAARLKAVQSRRIHYRCSGLTPFDIPIVVEQKRPSFYRRESSVLGATQISAFDGVAGWKVDPLLTFSTQPIGLTPTEAREMEKDATFDSPFLDYAAKGHQVAYLGLQVQDGRPVDALRLTLKSGEALTCYLDARTHLASRWVATTHPKDKDVQVTTTLGDYRMVQGVAYPFLIEIASGDGAWSMKLVAESVEPDAVIDEARFHRPAAPTQASK